MPVAAWAKGKLSLLRADNHQVDHSHSSSAGISCVEAVENLQTLTPEGMHVFVHFPAPLSVTDEVELVYACM